MVTIRTRHCEARSDVAIHDFVQTHKTKEKELKISFGLYIII